MKTIILLTIPVILSMCSYSCPYTQTDRIICGSDTITIQSAGCNMDLTKCKQAHGYWDNDRKISTIDITKRKP